jgi:hypothetical protein
MPLTHSADLVPKEIVQKWLQYLRQYFPTVAFKGVGMGMGIGMGTAGRPTLAAC